MALQTLSFLLLFGTPAVWWHGGPVQPALYPPRLTASVTGQLSVLQESQALGTCHSHSSISSSSVCKFLPSAL